MQFPYKELGEIFMWNGVKLVVARDPFHYNVCEPCYFFDKDAGCMERRKCIPKYRRDNKEIFYVEVK